VTSAVEQLLAREAEQGVASADFYSDFAQRVADLKHDVVSLLQRLKSEGAQVYAYGAAAKGTVLLNHFGVDNELVSLVVDRSPHKQDRLMPGVGIPIDDPSRLLHDQPDYVLLLVWNIVDEVLAQQEDYRSRGGRFIVPIPVLRVV
jgi:hypothetical protein